MSRHIAILGDRFMLAGAFERAVQTAEEVRRYLAGEPALNPC
jgi:hypothetical protein